MPAESQTVETSGRPVPVQLPDGLQLQFSALERRLWKVETAAAVCLAGGGLAGSYLTQFLSDRLWDTPWWLRGGISAVGWGVVAVAAYRWGRNWVWHRRDLKALADLVQRRFRRLGDRLLGIVELADESRRPAHFSPALYAAAIEQVAEQAQPYDFREAVEVGPVRRRAGWVAGLLVVGVVPFALVPAAALNSVQRWLAPLASIPRYTLVELAQFPAELVVPHGEPFRVEGTVRYRSFWKPSQAKGRFEQQPLLTAPVQAERVEFRVPNQVQDGRFTVRAGDAAHEVKVRPTHRPSLRDLTARIEFPEYLQYPPAEAAVQGGTLTLIEGGKVTFTGRATRALASAIGRRDGRDLFPLKVAGDGFTTDPISAEARLDFEWEDTLGLRGPAAWRLNVELAPDQAPMPEVVDLPRDLSMLESEVLTLKVQARDDFGVKEVGLVWAAGGDWTKTNAVTRTFQASAPSPREKRFVEGFGFSPSLLRLGPDSVVEVKGYALDFLPGRAPVESVVYRIQILGNERHAEMVRQQLESLQARLEEVTRLEEKVASGARELSGMKKEDLEADKNTERLGALQEDQAQNAMNLEQMAKEGSKTLREAMRNPLVPEETLREWSRNLQQMQQLARNEMRQAAESLQQAQKNPQSRAEETEKAREKAEQSLQALGEMQKQMNKGLDQLQALTLAQRLRKLSAGQKSLEGRLQKNIAEAIGLTPAELPEPLRKANVAVAAEQEEARKEAGTLQGEISRFHERTQRADYGAVNKEMTEARTAEELDRIKGLIGENIAMEAMQNLALWSQRFTAWAEKLEPKEKGGQSGSGSGGEGSGSQNEMAEKLIKTLIGLLRLRESEGTLREQTRLLDGRKEDVPIYLFNAELLAGKQRESMMDLGRLQRGNPLAMLEPLFGETLDSMTGVEGLLKKPETGAPTRTAQGKTGELITDAINLINEQIQQKNDSSAASGGGSASQEMAFLMQMMAQARAQAMSASAGNQGGGSQAGGSTDRPAEEALGDARGKRGEGRGVDKATGFGGPVPAEFREALQNYFNALEKEGR